MESGGEDDWPRSYDPQLHLLTLGSMAASMPGHRATMFETPPPPEQGKLDLLSMSCSLFRYPGFLNESMDA
jgi:hypothetical protein